MNRFLPGMCHTHFETAGFLLEFRKSTELERGERMVIDGLCELYGWS